ncbi:MAG: 50S ribosomal protein L21 [Candidatus Kerfeldbacteria bacterium]|nr:50S ribosomal protein L21 [Candidatus Kerfeldbacteria bacterium]
MFAIIETGGKQYKVKEGQTLMVEKLPVETGPVVFDRVLLIGGDAVKVGTPNVAGAKVEASVAGQVKAKKVTVIKYKAKVRYRRKIGHRQQYSKVTITKITAPTSA